MIDIILIIVLFEASVVIYGILRGIFKRITEPQDEE